MRHIHKAHFNKPKAQMSIKEASGSFTSILWAVGSLVVRASDSRPEGLGPMPDATEHPPSTCSLNQWVRSLVGLIMSAGTGEYFPPLQFTCRNCGGGDRGHVAIYRPFGELRRAKIVLSPVWCSRPTTGVPLAHATMNFVGLDLTASDRTNINGLSTYAMNVKLDQLLELTDTHNAQIIAIEKKKLKEQTNLNIKVFNTSTDLEIQAVSIFWGKHKLNIFNMYHPPNQGCLPDSFLDLAAANVPSIFIGDLNAEHTSWGCSVNNSRDFGLLNAADDRSLLFLNDGSQIHRSFSYNTAEALHIAPASADVFPFCRWSVFGNIGSDHLPIKIEL
ncbi:hypothetical protein TNCV_3556541 [Trichonephila clavipes]|uniref:Endonuclease/exonuclease/phosphatase domain-containing protein n=1 Tax=Trichonephila clavipes TaxID=2585209 RepID=A0A8X7BHQ2_TRICX|nr:hypothetical protein TNCV_3556541 [Trichonephila clavipes]